MSIYALLSLFVYKIEGLLPVTSEALPILMINLRNAPDHEIFLPHITVVEFTVT